MVVSLVRMSDRASLTRAFNILLQLPRERRLMPDKQGWIAGLQKALGEPAAEMQFTATDAMGAKDEQRTSPLIYADER